MVNISAALKRRSERPQVKSCARGRSRSQSGYGRHGPDLDATLLLQQFRDQESHVDRLLGVEARIADRVVAVVEILVGDRPRTADAFGDVLPGHLQMDAAGVGAL